MAREKFMNDILLRTEQISRAEYINEMSKKKDEDGSEYPCNMCGKSFKNKKEYDMHKNGKNSDKSYYCKAMKEDVEIIEADDETDGGSEGGDDEVSKLKATIKELKAEIKELKGGKKKKKKDKKDDDEGDGEDHDGDGHSSAADADDDKMAKLRAMKK